MVQRLRVEASAFETRLSMRDSSALESLAEKEASVRSRLEAAAESHRDAVQVLRNSISRKDRLVEDLRKVKEFVKKKLIFLFMKGNPCSVDWCHCSLMKCDDLLRLINRPTDPLPN